MAIIPRRALAGQYLRILGRDYRLPDYARDTLGGMNTKVWVDDDGVLPKDRPDLGLSTIGNVRVFWPTRYKWLTNAMLDEKAR